MHTATYQIKNYLVEQPLGFKFTVLELAAVVGVGETATLAFVNTLLKKNYVKLLSGQSVSTRCYAMIEQPIHLLVKKQAGQPDHHTDKPHVTDAQLFKSPTDAAGYSLLSRDELVDRLNFVTKWVDAVVGKMTAPRLDSFSDAELLAELQRRQSPRVEDDDQFEEPSRNSSANNTTILAGD
jgi:hypothetical protein